MIGVKCHITFEGMNTLCGYSAIYGNKPNKWPQNVGQVSYDRLRTLGYNEIQALEQCVNNANCSVCIERARLKLYTLKSRRVN